MLWSIYLSYLRWFTYQYEMYLYDTGHQLIDKRYQATLQYWESL